MNKPFYALQLLTKTFFSKILSFQNNQKVRDFIYICIYVLNYPINKQVNEPVGKMVVFFVDLRAAFDSVNRGILMKAMKRKE